MIPPHQDNKAAAAQTFNMYEMPLPDEPGLRGTTVDRAYGALYNQLKHSLSHDTFYSSRDGQQLAQTLRPLDSVKDCASNLDASLPSTTPGCFKRPCPRLTANRPCSS